MHLIPGRLKHWPLPLAVLAMLAVTVLAYVPGLHGPFLFDDTSNITGNPALRMAGLTFPALMHAAFSSDSGLLYRPLSMLSFALNYFFFGPGVSSFKLTNVCVHLANALLIFWLTFRLLWNCRRRYQYIWTDAHIRWMALIVAATWALHPLNLTAVLYVVQRMTSLAALFTLAGMLSYLYGRERSLAGHAGWPLIWILTPFFGVLGVLCKEDAALLPLFLVVTEWLIFGFRNRDQRISRNVMLFYLFGLVLPGLIGGAYLVHRHFWIWYAGRDFTLSERILTEFRVVFLYIKWTFFPDIRELALYHDDIAVSTGLLHPTTTLLSLLALLAILALAFWQRRKRPLLCLGILFFFAGQAMESTVLPLLLAFEHRNYLPDYGLLLAFFSLLLLPGERGMEVLRPSLRWAIGILILPVVFSATFVRASEWSNYLSFAYYESHHHPHSEQALYALGQAYSDLALNGQLRNPDVALQALSQAAARSRNIMPDVAMMIVSSKLKRPANPAWERHAKQLLLEHPVEVQDIQSLDSLVHCLPHQCQGLKTTTFTLLQAAFTSAHRRHREASPDLWIVYSNYLTFTGHPLSEVISAMAQAVRLAPKVPQYQVNLAEAYIVVANFPAAEARIKALARLNKFGAQDQTISDLKQKLAAARASGPIPETRSQY